jgi:hypothetical protein
MLMADVADMAEMRFWSMRGLFAGAKIGAGPKEAIVAALAATSS